MAGTYMVMRYKFWYIDEGDELFNFNAWAKQANQRLDFIENDGVREAEKENFKFEVDAEPGVQMETGADYSNPEEVMRQNKAREA